MSASHSAGHLVRRSTLGIVLAALLLAVLAVLLVHVEEAGGQPAPEHDSALFLPLQRNCVNLAVRPAAHSRHAPGALSFNAMFSPTSP